ncbi:MAG: SMP-30/gluconolactonase/LRE family protein, partial [Acidimicrobiia bacterium]
MVVEVFEAEVGRLVGDDAKLEKLADGFVFTEGPVWDFRAGRLYFSDIPADTLYRYSPGEGTEVYRRPSNFSNGLTIDLEGRLVACEHRTRRVTREEDGAPAVVVERYQELRLNAPNDVVAARDGSLVFTDPPYGLGEGFGGPAHQELPFRGVYRVAAGSQPELLADDFQGPNGLALSPNETVLYVDDTEQGHIRRFGVAEGWRLTGGEVLVELRGEGEGV